MQRPRARSLAAIAALASLVLAGHVADAGKKKKKKKGGDGGGAGAAVGAPACGIDFLPLAQGRQWTYKFFVPENSTPPAGQLHIPEPETVTIQVVKVEAQGESTKITVSESYRKVTVETVLTCDKDRLLIPPDSFFFAGEPGGGIGIQLDKLERKGDSVLLEKGLGENTFQEFKATAIRKPSDGSGATIPGARLEIERKMTAKGKDTIETDTGEPQKAIRVDIQLTGRAALDVQKDKPFNMPAFDSSMWFAPGVGVIRVETKAGVGWKLVESKNG
ncbi:MAG TPA: hypothetical protein VMZ28_01770 [Kofleriaceae bacterium]|nr:hypothetical protein [Kofleriaceae bacterium]